MLAKLHPKKDEGFTLIELLIVIIVLGILVAIVLFSLGTFKSDSSLAACKADLKQIRTAETAYFSKNNAYVTDLTALKTASYIQDVPSTANYTISVTTAGVVSSTLSGCA